MIMLNITKNKIMKTPHVVVKDNNIVCENCGYSLKIPLPIDIDILAAMGKAFIKIHKNCIKKVNP